MTNAADAVVETLAQAGVNKVFGVIGTSTMDIADAIGRDPRLEFVSARAEEAAAHMADGYARASGRVGVILAHVGPGALRLMYGVGTAFKDGVPLVLLTGNEVLRATDTQMREGYHVIDVLELYRPITKATLQLREPADAGVSVARALWLAASGRPGPVLLDLPKSSLKQPFDGAPVRAGMLGDQVPPKRLPAPQADLQAAAAAVEAADRPLLFAGGGIHWSGAHEALIELATSRNLPVLTTDGGRGSIPEDHPLSLGIIARQAGDAVARSLLAEADLVLAIGTPFSDVSTFEWSAWSDDATVVQVDISDELAHKGTSPDLFVVADAREFLTGLQAVLDQRDYRCKRDWQDLRTRLTEERDELLRLADDHPANRPVSPWVLIDELAATLPRDAFVSVDSGLHSYFGKKLPIHAPRSYIRSAGFGAMGYSFPAILGALEAADDGRRGVAIVGDGCLSMGLGEFETAARRGSPLTLVVFNDARFASQQGHQHRRFDGRVVGTEFTVTDYVGVARAQGVPGWTATNDEEARQAIRDALALGGPSVIDARIDRDVQPATWIEGSGDQRLAAATATG